MMNNHKLFDQMVDSNFPLRATRTKTGENLILNFCPLPNTIKGYTVTGAVVSVKNADGLLTTAEATEILPGEWRAEIDAAHFSSWGYVSRGLRFSVRLTDATGGVRTQTLAVGDVDIAPRDATTPHGDPTKHYQIKGDDEYWKSYIENGVQHYKRQKLVYDDEMMDWGAVWEGDYILVQGEYIPYNEGE